MQSDQMVAYVFELFKAGGRDAWNFIVGLYFINFFTVFIKCFIMFKKTCCISPRFHAFSLAQ